MAASILSIGTAVPPARVPLLRRHRGFPRFRLGVEPAAILPLPLAGERVDPRVHLDPQRAARGAS